MKSSFALFLLAFLAPATVHANGVTISAQKDNTMYAESGSESNGAGDNFFAGVNGMGQIRRALIQFDVASAVPAGSTINSAQLILYMSMTNAGAKTIELHPLLASWGEGNSNAGSGEGSGTTAQTNDATWTRRFYNTISWTTPGSDFAAAASASTSVDQIGYYAFGSNAAMVADVQGWLTTPANNFGWLVLNTDEFTQPTAKRFSSRTNPTGAQRPKLVIDFTPPSPFTAYCFGDGSGTACPCANAGATGNGCANSLNANGANLAATGTPSIANDTLVITGTGMPNSSALYFQGTTQQSAGAGAVFGDGLRCAAGSVVRLGTKANATGASQYPAVGDPSISVKGLVTSAGVTRTYQCWYRNAANFCNVETFNLSNGISVVWGP